MDVTADDSDEPLGLDARRRPVPPLAGAGCADPRRSHRRAPRRLCRLVLVVDDPLAGEPHAIVAIEQPRPPPAPAAAAIATPRPRPGREAPPPQRRRGRERLRRVDRAPDRRRVRRRASSSGSRTASRQACAGARPAARRADPARAAAEASARTAPALPTSMPARRRRRPAARAPGADRAPGRRPRHQPERDRGRHRQAAAGRDPRLRALRHRSRRDRGGARASDGHEVMLQVPMEPFDYPDNDPGPHTLDGAGEPAGEHRPAALGDGPLHGLCRHRQLHGRASSPRTRRALAPDPARDRRPRPRLPRRRLVAALARRRAGAERPRPGGAGRPSCSTRTDAGRGDRPRARPARGDRARTGLRDRHRRARCRLRSSASRAGRARSRREASSSCRSSAVRAAQAGDDGRGTGGRRPAHELPYRPCVGVMLLNRDGLVFLGRRQSEAGPRACRGRLCLADAAGRHRPGRGALRGRRSASSTRKPTSRSVELLAEAPDWYRLRPAGRRSPARAWKGRYPRADARNGSRSASPATTARSTSATGGGGTSREFDAWRWERMDAPARPDHSVQAAGLRARRRGLRPPRRPRRGEGGSAVAVRQADISLRRLLA